MTYLLDTNVCIEFLRGRDSGVIQHLAATSANDVRLCSVVKAELYHGARRSQQSQTNLIKVEDFARRFLSLPFSSASLSMMMPRVSTGGSGLISKHSVSRSGRTTSRLRPSPWSID